MQKNTNKVFLIIIIFLLPACFALSNDGAFYSEGINLYPFQETVIELRKEILNLTLKNDIMFVDVYFEFYNPLKTTKKLLVGFESPAPSGAVSKINIKNLLQNFNVKFNGRLVPFNVSRIGELDSNKMNDEQDYRHIAYTFYLNFKPGMNFVKHSYKYSGGELLANKDYSYILKTGNRWANKQIDNFTLMINFMNNCYATFPASFEKGNIINWEIHGDYKIHDKIINYDSTERKKGFKHEKNFYDFGTKLIKIKKAKFIFKKNNFIPENDIYIRTNSHKSSSLLPFLESIYGLDLKLDLYNDFIKNYSPKKIKKYSLLKENNFKLNKEQIELYKNFIYSTYDYNFKDPEIKKSFEKYFWYMPNNKQNLHIDEYDKSIIDDLNQLLQN